MSKPIHIQIVAKARSLLQDEKAWCRGELAFDNSGSPVCPTDKPRVSGVRTAPWWQLPIVWLETASEHSI